MAACTGTPTAEGPSETSAELERLGQDYWDFLMETSPTWATYLKDYRWNDRLEDIGPDGRRRVANQTHDFLERLAQIEPDPLTESERVSYDILKTYLDDTLARQHHKFYQWAVDQMDGPQVWLPELLRNHPQKSDKDFEDLIKRFKAFPRWIKQYIANLREGLREKRVAPKVAVVRVIDQLQQIVDTKVEASALLPDAGPRLRLISAIRDEVYPAFHRLLLFLRETYLSQAREEVGLSSIPGGREAYAYRIRHHTSLSLSAEEIHQIGLEELRTIHKEMEEIARRVGHQGDVASFLLAVTASPSNFASSREQLLTGFRAILQRVDQELPKYFKTFPSIGYEVKPMPAYQERDAPAAYYYGPPDDGSRLGIFYANTYKPSSRPLYTMAALAVHEAVPGHHTQIVIARDQKDLPTFRRHGHFTSFSEGWALYAERLADEMGIYDGDIERFGMLTYQAWRAARLVVDTGMHAKGWTRKQAMDFFRSNVGLSETELANEIDRYIIWPGQALAYMIGKLEIMRLRAWAREQLGEAFDIREFHDRVLLNGPLPLSTLQDNIERWVSAQKN